MLVDKSDPSDRTIDTAPPLAGANRALALMLIINLFNYIDRQVLSAVLPRLQMDGTLFAADDTNVQLKLGALTSAFLAAYMLFSPLVGWLDGHGYRRWIILGVGVSRWSLASGGSGFATTYWILFLTRCFVGVGEGAYVPVSSAMIADIYPPRQRSTVIALYNMAIPVGSAIGFLIGGQVSDYFDDWRHAFWFTFLGLFLGVLCFLKKEFPRPKVITANTVAHSYFDVLRLLTRNKSFVMCCAGMTAITFVIGGVAAWVPAYVFQREARFVMTTKTLESLENPPADVKRHPVPAATITKLQPKVDGEERDLVAFKKHISPAIDEKESALYLESIIVVSTTESSPKLGTISTIFGGIVVIGGLVATGVGAWLGEVLKPRLNGAYFVVIGVGALLAFPCYLGLLYAPFPLAWLFVFLSVFGLFMHVGPGNTILANVVTSDVRATAFAINILVIHALGDVISPPLIGAVADVSSLQTAFLLMSVMIILGGVLWIAGARFLEADTRRAIEAEKRNG